MVAIVRKLWNGGYPLPISFWGFYIGGSILSGLAAGLVLFASNENVYVFFLLHAIRAVILIVTSVGVWRSAKSEIASPIWLSRMWGYVARYVVVVWIGHDVLLSSTEKKRELSGVVPDSRNKSVTCELHATESFPGRAGSFRYGHLLA